MKNKIALILFFFCLIGVFNPLFAQQKQNVFKINPLSLALANLSLSYERAISDNKSILLHGAYWLGFNVENSKFDGYFFSPEFRFYVTDHGVPEGFYIGPYGRLESLNGRSDVAGGGSVKVTRIGAGVNAGYQFLFGEKVTLDIFLGPKYLSNTIKYSDGSTDDDLNLDRFNGNFGFRFGTTVGIAF